MKKRIISFLLSLCMVWSLLPGAAWAAETNSVPSSAPSTIEVQQSNEGRKAVADSNGTTVQVNDGKAVIIKDNTQTEYGTLDEAMEAAASVDTIYLGKGTYCGNATSPTMAGKGAGKSLTFVGAGTDKTTWQINAPATAYGSDGWCDYSFKNSDSIIFQNMTVVSSVYPDKTTKANDTQGLTYINHITLKNCIFNGRADYWGYETTTFENVIFNAPGTERSGVTDKTDYSLWTYTGNSYEFKNCTFNSAGKTINVYRHNTEQFQSNVTINFESCTVKNTTHKKQAMKINDQTMGDYKYIINISGDNTVEGIEPNKFTCSRLFGFDPDDNNPDASSENSGRTVVNIEGTTVWENGARQVEHNHDFGTGSYSNGKVEDPANKYTDGYKDNAFTTTYGSWTWDQNKNQLARTVTKTCDYCGEPVKTTEYKDLELDVSRSKTATALDSNYQSTVTLSLPSAEENLVSDVVFVLDESDCNEAVLTEMTDLLSGLRETAQANNASINVGVIFFRGIAATAYPLTKYTGNNEPILKAISDANSQMTMKGTNLPAGLQAAESMLSTSNTSATRQYMILVSDGATYLYTHDNDPTTHYSRTSGYYSMDGGLYEWQAKYDPDIYGKNSIPYALPKDFSHNGNATDWENFLNEIALKRETFVSFDQEYVRTKDKAAADLTKPDPIYTGDTIKDFVTNVEESFYQSATAYQQIVKSGVNCYSIAVNDNMGVFTTFANYLAELGKGSGMNFDSIKNDILYAIGEGSVVEDKMGADFDFVPGSLKLTVNKEPLDSKVDGNTTYFGAKDTKKEIGSDNYRFKVEYNSTDDKFIWTINENVSNFAPVQLSYKVTLVKPNTAAGTYGQTDLNGDGKVDGTNTDVDPNTALYTNESATLTPTDSEGHQGKPLTFPKPSVSYTVKSSSSGGSSSSDTPSPTPETTPETTPTPVVTVTGAIPKTGDDSSVTLWMVLCVASALALGGVSFYHRKKR